MTGSTVSSTEAAEELAAGSATVVNSTSADSGVEECADGTSSIVLSVVTASLGFELSEVTCETTTGDVVVISPTTDSGCFSFSCTSSGARVVGAIEEEDEVSSLETTGAGCVVAISLRLTSVELTSLVAEFSVLDEKV